MRVELRIEAVEFITQPFRDCLLAPRPPPRSKTQASRQALGNFQIEDDEEDLSGMQKFVKCLQETFSLKNLRKYVRIPTYRQVLRVLYKWPYIWYLHASRFFFGSFQDPQLASSSERQYLGHRFQIDPEGEDWRE